MAKYRDNITGEVIEVGDPSLNAGLIAGKTQVPENTPFGSITGESLTPTSDISSKVIQPTPTITPPVAGLNTEVTEVPKLELTAPETDVQKRISEVLGLREGLKGEKSFRAEQEKAAGFPELNRTQTDLSSRLKALQNEALAIPLQLQQEAVGRGITAGGLQPLQTAALRNNAIQALSVSSLLEASRGNLALAQDQADRAVAAKYDPIKEEIAVKLANLDLILKSPEYTVAEKNRAQAQKTAHEAKNREVVKQEENSKTAQAMATAAVKLNPGNQGALFAAQQVQNLDPSDSQYLSKVFGLVGQYQTNPEETKLALLKQQQIQQDLKLNIDKFEEDKRQFGLKYAFDQQKK